MTLNQSMGNEFKHLMVNKMIDRLEDKLANY